MHRSRVMLAILLPILAQSGLIGDGGDSANSCAIDGQSCNAPADDTGLWLMQRRSALLSSDNRMSDSELVVDRTSGRFNSQIEDEILDVVAKFERLGHPRDVLVTQLKDQLINVSLSEVHGRLGLAKRPMAPECVAVKAAAASYRFGESAGLFSGPAAAKDLQDEGYTFVQGFKTVDGKDVDYVGWWEKRGNCMFNFQGSDDPVDFKNDFNANLTTAWGIDGLHDGLVTELGAMVEQINFQKVKAKCRTLTSIGHSLGGGLAMLFALILNQRDDPLDANIKADALYTFGGMSCGKENFPDQHRWDGCFDGRVYYNAQRHKDGTIGVDIVNNPKIGGLSLEPVKAPKALLVSPRDHLNFECGHLIPNTFGDTKFDLHMIPTYAYNLGCTGLVEYLLDMVNLVKGGMSDQFKKR